MGFTWIPDADDAAAATWGQCGPGGCTPGKPAADCHSEPATENENEHEPVCKMLICPTCDEPFAPEYPRLCEWCGHQFDDGFEVDLPAGHPEEITSRMYAVVFGLLALVVVAVAYFAIVL